MGWRFVAHRIGHGDTPRIVWRSVIEGPACPSCPSLPRKALVRFKTSDAFFGSLGEPRKQARSNEKSLESALSGTTSIKAVREPRFRARARGKRTIPTPEAHTNEQF